MYSGLSLEAATLWPLICVGLVCFFNTLPALWPLEDSQDTLSPAFSDFVITGMLLNDIHRQLGLAGCVPPSIPHDLNGDGLRSSALQHRTVGFSERAC
jgi:hypothetical protein